MFPQISVVMSTYNRGNRENGGFLYAAVESILNQTFSDFEFIIINDNSQDNTAEIINEFQDKRIKLFNNSKNFGCTFNCHAANNLAKGKYIAHLDDDDISMPDRLKKQFSYMEQHEDIALSGSFIETFGENSRPSWVFYTTPEKLDFMMNFYNPICHSSVIYRKAFLDKYAINYDLKKQCAQDYDLYKQILLNKGKLANIDEVLVKYRMHSNRITDVKNTQEIQIYNANLVKKELMSRFFDENQISEITALVHGFPFNEYNIEDVINALYKTSEKYKLIYENFDIIAEEINIDVKRNLFKF